MSLSVVTILLLLAVSSSALPSHQHEAEWDESSLIMEGEGAHSRMAPMGAMVEPAGKVGRDECRLRSIDRVLRQHKGKFQTVQDAMDTFSSSLESVKEAHVARYLNCVTGMGMMLPDCSMMPWDHGVKVDDIKKYLETSSEMTKLVKAADSVDAFAAHMKDVEGVVCDKSVMDAVQGHPDKKVAESDMSDMKMGGMKMDDMETDGKKKDGKKKDGKKIDGMKMDDDKTKVSKGEAKKQEDTVEDEPFNTDDSMKMDDDKTKAAKASAHRTTAEDEPFNTDNKGDNMKMDPNMKMGDN